jgi:hypothetical protein
MQIPQIWSVPYKYWTLQIDGVLATFLGHVRPKNPDLTCLFIIKWIF